MSEFDNFDADALISQIQREEAEQRRISGLVGSYITRLAEQGVNVQGFEANYGEEPWDTGDTLSSESLLATPIDRLKARAKANVRAINIRSALNLLAYYKILTDEVGAAGLDLSVETTKWKKNLQADLWNDGLDTELIELVEAELPGEGLTDDYDYLLSRREVVEERSQETRGFQQEIRGQMAESLGLSDEDRLNKATALNELADTYVSLIDDSALAAKISMPYRGYEISARDDARVILLKYGLNNPHWIEVVDSWFGDFGEQP